MDLYDSQRAQVFISYTSDDRPLVENFVACLTDDAISAAASIWYDRRLDASFDWKEEVLRRIDRADVVLVLASPRFFQSEFCVETEVRLIRRRVFPASASSTPERDDERPPTVRVIRLRPLDHDASMFDGLPSWPDQRSVQELDPKGAEFDELRGWLKVEICKALVARHSDRYDGRTREQELAAREADPSRALVMSQTDDLTHLHQVLGVRVSSGRRLASAVASGVAIGAVASHLVRSHVLPGEFTSLVPPILYFVMLGFVLGCIKVVFRAIELPFDSARARGAEGSSFSTWGMLRILVPLAAMSGAARAVQLGIGLGAPLGAVLLVTGWRLHPGPVGSAAVGGVLGLIAGLDSALSFSPIQLQVFTDVRHAYRPPVVPPLPTFDALALSHALARQDDGPSSSPVATHTGSESAPGHGRPSSWSDDDDEEDEMNGDETADEPEGDDALPTKPEHVASDLVIVVSEARRQEAHELHAEMLAHHLDDLFRISILTDADARSQSDEYWKRTLTYPGRCVVLMTQELLLTTVPQVIDDAASHRPRQVYPVFVDSGLRTSGPLMSYQALPTGHMALNDWPIRSNAWVNVCRSVLNDERDAFMARLAHYMTEVEAAEAFARTADMKSPIDRELAVLHSTCDDDLRDQFVDPRRDFARFPFQHRAWYWSGWRASMWAVVGALCIGAIGKEIAGRVGPNPGRFDVAFLHVVPGLILTVVLAWLLLKDTVSYGEIRLHGRKRDQPGILDFIFGASHDSLARRPVLIRTLKLLLRPVLLLAAGLVGLVTARASAPLGMSAGACVGLGCYLASRYRVPAVVLAPDVIPGPDDVRVLRQGLQWTISAPGDDASQRERSRIGAAQSPRPRLIQGFRRELSFSVGMFVRAMFDAAWITAAGLAVFALFASIGAWAILIALHLMSALLYAVSHGGRILRQSKGDSAWQVVRYFGPSAIDAVVRTMTFHAGVIMVSLAGSRWFPAHASIFRWMLPVGLVTVTLVQRLIDQLITTARADSTGRA